MSLKQIKHTEVIRLDSDVTKSITPESAASLPMIFSLFSLKFRLHFFLVEILFSESNIMAISVFLAVLLYLYGVLGLQ